jgi:hypothetical protein
LDVQATVFSGEKKILACFFFSPEPLAEQRVHVFLKVECAWDTLIGYTKLPAHSSFKKMMQGTW